MKQIDTNQWKEFVIKDIFTLKRPAARSQANYNDGSVPFVASGNFNNGILKYLEPKKDEALDAGNCITVSPIDGSSFYQEHDFLGRGGAGSSIILLYNPNLNLSVPQRVKTKRNFFPSRGHQLVYGLKILLFHIFGTCRSFLCRCPHIEFLQ